MKKTALTAVLFGLILLLLTGCSPAKGAKTHEELVKRYLDALAQEKYEEVLLLLPDEIIEYGREQLGGKCEDVVEFVKYAAHDYHWLAKANMPAHKDYSFEIVSQSAEFPEAKKPGSVLMEEDSVRLYVKDAVSLRIELDVGQDEPVPGYFFLIRIEDRWYMMSVAGDDELLYY